MCFHTLGGGLAGGVEKIHTFFFLEGLPYKTKIGPLTGDLPSNKDENQRFLLTQALLIKFESAKQSGFHL